jgi:hypothetical protein
MESRHLVRVELCRTVESTDEAAARIPADSYEMTLFDLRSGDINALAVLRFAKDAHSRILRRPKRPARARSRSRKSQRYLTTLAYAFLRAAN